MDLCAQRRHPQCHLLSLGARRERLQCQGVRYLHHPQVPSSRGPEGDHHISPLGRSGGETSPRHRQFGGDNTNAAATFRLQQRHRRDISASAKTSQLQRRAERSPPSCRPRLTNDVTLRQEPIGVMKTVSIHAAVVDTSHQGAQTACALGGASGIDTNCSTPTSRTTIDFQADEARDRVPKYEMNLDGTHWRAPWQTRRTSLLSYPKT